LAARVAVIAILSTSGSALVPCSVTWVPVERHAACGDEFFGFAGGGDACGGDYFLEAFRGHGWL